MTAHGLVAGTHAPSVPGELAEALVSAGRRMDRRGWVPATSGNLSARMDGDCMAITRSGVHKGFLAPRDIIAVDFNGQSLTPGMKPSAETLLHAQIYRLWPDVGSVLHGHSVPATALTLALPQARVIALEGYELLKAWTAVTTHEASVSLPVVDNDQDMQRLAIRLAPALEAGEAPLGYVLRGHGVYVWGADVTAALYRMEALEFLLATEYRTEEALMSRLTIYNDDAPDLPVLRTEDATAIAEELGAIDVRFERWDSPVTLSPDDDADKILVAYRPYLETLMGSAGAGSADVIKLTPEHPQAAPLRAKFINEHSHTEDEVRFFVHGSGKLHPAPERPHLRCALHGRRPHQRAGQHQALVRCR